jgi:hypothetical protein
MRHRFAAACAFAGLVVALRPAQGGTPAELAEALSRAPMESADAPAGVVIALPLPDGRSERFRAVESPILAPAMQRAFPAIRTYRAVGVNDPLATARIDVTPLGVRAIVSSSRGTVLIDPLDRGRTDALVSRWVGHEAARASFECTAIERGPAPESPRARVRGVAPVLRSYRLILLGNGEYTQSLGGGTLATAEMVTSVNRVNAIYERDFGVRLEIVALVPFPDPSTDPYATGVFGDLDRAQAVADSLFSPSSYDVAQLLLVSGPPGAFSGVSYRPAVCSPVKAGCMVGGGDLSAGDYTIKVMSHELGHALGAEHTAGCGSPIVAASYEPGSGSTIMAVGGRCAANNVTTAPGDLYFHLSNIEQVLQTLGSLPGCGTSAATGNTAPTVDAGPDRTIPLGTPYVLEGTGFDPDPDDALEFSWDQYDRAVAAGDTVTGPMVRHRIPTPAPRRDIPRGVTVLADTLDAFEKLPRSDRSMHFRLVARDNHAGGGAVTWDEMVITAAGAPFEVTSPNGGETIPSGFFPVTWNVGGGSVAAAVNVLLSIDGGATWSTVAADVPNDGAQDVAHFTQVVLPCCRIRVEAAGNIFYDVSHADFTIEAGTTDVDPASALDFALRNEGPNPSSDLVTLGIRIPRATTIRLGVYSVAGRLIRALGSGVWAAGEHRIAWDGTDGTGRRVGPGLYLARLDVDGSRKTVRAVVLR